MTKVKAISNGLRSLGVLAEGISGNQQERSRQHLTTARHGTPRLEEKIANHAKGGRRRDEVWDVSAKGANYHDASQDQDGVHGPVFEVAIFLDGFHVAHGQFADHECPQAVADQDQRDGQGEGESAENSVDGKGGVDDLQIEYLGQIRFVGGNKIALALLGVLFESVGNEKGRRAHHGGKGHHGIHPHGEPDHDGEQDRGHGIEPDPLAHEEALSGQPEIFILKKKPMEKEQDQEDPSAKQQDRSGEIDRIHDPWIAGEGGREGLARSYSGRQRPDDAPGQQSAHPEHGDEDTPEEKPAPEFWTHGREYLGIDDGVVDGAYGFK